jgi:hypothetical protein
MGIKSMHATEGHTTAENIIQSSQPSFRWKRIREYILSDKVINTSNDNIAASHSSVFPRVSGCRDLMAADVERIVDMILGWCGSKEWDSYSGAGIFFVDTPQLQWPWVVHRSFLSQSSKTETLPFRPSAHTYISLSPPTNPHICSNEQLG